MKPVRLDPRVHTLDVLLRPYRDVRSFQQEYHWRLRHPDGQDELLEPTDPLAVFNIVPTDWYISQLVGSSWRHFLTGSLFVVDHILDDGSGRPLLARNFDPEHPSRNLWLGQWFSQRLCPIYLVHNWVRVDCLSRDQQAEWNDWEVYQNTPFFHPAFTPAHLAVPLERNLT